jgi:YD repeat-containing protein
VYGAWGGATRIRTVYDFPENARQYLTVSAFLPSEQTDVQQQELNDILASLTNTRGRVVASIAYDNDFSGDTSKEPVYAGKVIDLFSYDDEGRVVRKYKSIPDLPLQTIKFGYDLQGKPIADTIEYDDPITHIITRIVTVYKYNARGKLWRTVRNGKEFTRYEYDDLDRLTKKTFLNGSTASHQVSYAYNIRDWVSKIYADDSTFSEQLCYDDNNGLGTVTGFQPQPQYNGNISRAAYDVKLAFNGSSLDLIYSYDQMNRLTGVANNKTYDSAAEYNAAFQYLNDGRILQKHEGSAQKDWGDYNYIRNTNQLVGIANSPKAGLYQNPQVMPPNYVYDYNGNMVFDRSKGMVVTYDWRNLPVKFSFYKDIPVGPLWNRVLSSYYDIQWHQFSGTLVSEVIMTYDASGNRVKKEVEESFSRLFIDELYRVQVYIREEVF